MKKFITAVFCTALALRRSWTSSCFRWFYYTIEPSKSPVLREIFLLFLSVFLSVEHLAHSLVVGIFVNHFIKVFIPDKMAYHNVSPAVNDDHFFRCRAVLIFLIQFCCIGSFLHCNFPFYLSIGLQLMIMAYWRIFCVDTSFLAYRQGVFCFIWRMKYTL